MSSTELRERNREAQRRWRSEPDNKVKEKKRRNREGEYLATRARKADPARWGSTQMCSIRYRATQRGLECTVEADDIVVPALCPVLNVPFVMGSVGRADPHAPSIDRVDNSKGYTPDNVRVISTRANFLKKDATLTELRAIVKYMEAHNDHHCLSRRPDGLRQPSHRQRDALRQGQEDTQAP